MNFTSFFTFFSLWLCLSANASPLPLIPLPAEVKLTGKSFPIGVSTTIITPPKLKKEAQVLADGLSDSTGYRHQVYTRKIRGVKQAIHLALDPSLPENHHQILITPEKAQISGHDAVALSHGIQSLIRILPEKTRTQNRTIPCLEIRDHAGTVAHRALQLDLASHLYPVKDLKMLINQLALLKMNTIILGFNNSGGWRLESKHHPTLTTIGASRPATKEDDTNEETYAGHYTQEAIKELILHAQARHIQVIPSFIFPEHAEPILASLPHLDSMDSDSAKIFLNEILGEVAALFPSKVIHLETSPEYFETHLKTALEQHELTRLDDVNWTTIDLAPWQHPPGLVKGQKAAPGLLTLDQIHGMTLAPESQGIRALLGTAFVPNTKSLTYTLFPRLAAIAEISWSSSTKYEEFLKRWIAHIPYYHQRKIEICPPYDQPKRQTLHGVQIETSLTHEKEFWPELSYDGRHETYFKSNPHLKKDDYLTFHFPVALTGSIEIATGGKLEKDTELLEGILETSTDGKQWDSLTEFFDGLIAVDLPQGTKHLRIRCSQAQAQPFTLHELKFSEAPLFPNFTETRTVALSPVIHLPIVFSCDFSKHPNLTEKIHYFRNDFFTNYKSMCEILGCLNDQDTPHSITLHLEKTAGKPFLNPRILEESTPEKARELFIDSLFHHLCGYQGSEPDWFRTGISNYLQQRYLNSKTILGDRPLSGGAESGAFLQWFAEKYGLSILTYLSKACRTGQYQERLWQIITQKTLQELASDYQKDRLEKKK